MKICLKCGKVVNDLNSIMSNLEKERKFIEDRDNKEKIRLNKAKELYKIYKDKETVQK